MKDILAIIPGLRRIVFLRRLFDWLNESLQASRNSTTKGYPELPDLLLKSLERMGDEIASVSLLKYCDMLQALNARIKAIKGPGSDADAGAIALQLDYLPDVEDQYKMVRRDCLKTIVAWAVIPAMVIIVIGLLSCRL